MGEYVFTHVLLWSGAIVYYAVTGPRMPIPLLVITITLNVTIEVLLVILACCDPGIIPRIVPEY